MSSIVHYLEINSILVFLIHNFFYARFNLQLHLYIICISGGAGWISLWLACVLDGGSDRCVAAIEAPAALAAQASRACGGTFSVRPSAVDRQFRSRFRFRVRFPSVVRVVAVYHFRTIRAPAEDSISLGVFSVGSGDDVRAGGSVLRGSGVRVRGVCVFHVLAVRARHVRVAGRARAADGRGMTARGPGVPAAAAPPRARLRPARTHDLPPSRSVKTHSVTF